MTDFDRAWEFLKPAAEHWGEHTRGTVFNAIQRGARIWAGDRCAYVASIRMCPSGLRVSDAWLAGGDLDELVTFEPSMVEWAKANGCDEIRLYGRRGFLRALPGFSEIGTVLRRKLDV